MLADDGAERLTEVISEDLLVTLKTLVGGFAQRRPGQRIVGSPELAHWLSASPLLDVAAGLLESSARPVRAILFDKSPINNWALGWHQDRTIAVREQVNVPGFGPWSRKAGIDHVEPPFDLIERMLTMRVHLDPVQLDNAPLLIAPGSHRFGRIVQADVEGAVQRCGQIACLAAPGDVWLYRTAILHASSASRHDGRRRVLQLDFSAEELSEPLQWRGID